VLAGVGTIGAAFGFAYLTTYENEEKITCEMVKVFENGGRPGWVEDSRLRESEDSTQIGKEETIIVQVRSGLCPNSFIFFWQELIPSGNLRKFLFGKVNSKNEW